MNRYEIVIMLRAYLGQHTTPTSSWPNNEILRYSALEYVVNELIDRLRYRTYMEPREIAISFRSEIKESLNQVQENITGLTIIKLWLYCDEVMENLFYLYFPIAIDAD